MRRQGGGERDFFEHQLLRDEIGAGVLFRIKLLRTTNCNVPFTFAYNHLTLSRSLPLNVSTSAFHDHSVVYLSKARRQWRQIHIVPPRFLRPQTNSASSPSTAGASNILQHTATLGSRKLVFKLLPYLPLQISWAFKNAGHKKTTSPSALKRRTSFPTVNSTIVEYLVVV